MSLALPDSRSDRPAWLFVEENPNERIRSTARRFALEGSGHDTASHVVREAIQNSVYWSGVCKP